MQMVNNTIVLQYNMLQMPIERFRTLCTVMGKVFKSWLESVSGFLYTILCNCTGYIAPKNVKKLYNAKRGVKAMKTFPLAGHSQSCYLYLLQYNQCIADFLDANVNK